MSSLSRASRVALRAATTARIPSLGLATTLFTNKPTQVQPRFYSNPAPKEVSVLLDSASSGDLARVQEILTSKKVQVNDGDYDRRRPLHLAAAEGRVEVVKFLLTQGADANAEDRWGNTALDDALAAKHDNVISVLRQVGGQIGKGRIAEMGGILCQAASEGNVQHLQRLYDCGVPMHLTDYDARSPLHVAASEGHVSTVEFLIDHGAKINAVDRFGNTPLSDASRSRAKHKKAVIELLMAKGGVLESTEYEIKNDPLVPGSILRSLPFLALRSGAAHVEAFLPNDDESEFTLFESSHYTPKEFLAQLAPFIKAPFDTSYARSENNLLGKAWTSKQGVAFTDITERDLPHRYTQAKESGLKAGYVIPLAHNDKPFALLKFYLTESAKMTNEELEQFTTICSSMVTAGVLKKGRAPVMIDYPDIPKGQSAEVYEIVKDEEVFNANLVHHEVEWFYSLGIQKYYYERFSPKEIANHVHAFIAAKKVAATTGKPEDIMLNIESQAKDGNRSWLYMCPIQHDRMVEVERRIQAQILKLNSAKQAYTLEFFMSKQTVVPQGKKQLGLYVLEVSDFVNAEKVGKPHETNVTEVASVTFLRTKSEFIRKRYQELLSTAVAKISPVAQVFPTYRDGTTPIMFAFYQGAGTTTSYMLQLTELLKHNELLANRKFIETFANGVIVFSLYILPSPSQQERIDRLLKQFSMLHLVPESSLTSRFLGGEFTAEQYTYFSAASRFIYYFLNKRSEEFDVLAKSLKNDPMNLGRLRLLQTRLKREAVSQERIYSSIVNHGGVVSEIFNDFTRQTTTQRSAANPTLPPEILSKIKNEATTVLDQQILTGLTSFNAHILKTNFYSKNKSALSFRLDPRFLADSDWPQVPFGLFFVMGSDFQGFHIRFKDIARGGIRIIRSGDRQAYNTNLETLFAENYGLAYTQNKKNKDIPEFGSKGTVLLNLANQSNQFVAFQKYVSGLLDVIIPNNEVLDNYGREELLFLGPDEGTADFMEWAARYSAKRNYRYWRAFTTGKPTLLGGIPHDKFGMTTRSVHRYVLGCLRKAGLKEENVTKFQTGGPDGDLGSNEILISHDKTKAVVDGSGVLYDPLGIDREELTRLAKKRAMIKEFNPAKLSSGGFRLLVTDVNVTLPDGTLVESGLAFRNEFHLNPLSSADMFVPCGGRPESVNLANVNKLFDAKGQPRFKIIVEGANLFFTQDARMVLENAGVTLYKDASANKGGVTSSSLEVLAALSLNETEFEEHMSVKDEAHMPPFYRDYVKEIQDRIEADADLEFECIWREYERTKTPRYLLTDQVSDKINQLNDFVQNSSLWHNVELRNVVLYKAIPKRLTELIGLQAILDRVPETYLQAIFGAYLASRYVYKHGLEANEFAFFEFMQPLLAESGKTPMGPTGYPSGAGAKAEKPKKK